MKKFYRSACWLFPTLLLFVNIVPAQDADTINKRFVHYSVNPKHQRLRLFWKNENNQHFGSIQKLKDWLAEKNQILIFAMNGGMYKPDASPQGLYIEDGKQLSPLDTISGNGNFYLKPNGVFYVTMDDAAGICITDKFKTKTKIKYATQSGPMLLIDGKIHPAFNKNSANLTIRNGVGILDDNTVVFAMSKEVINFYEFANYFKQLGCKNALYLDGTISRTYLPQTNWTQLDGQFGVIVAITK